MGKLGPSNVVTKQSEGGNQPRGWSCVEHENSKG